MTVASSDPASDSVPLADATTAVIDPPARAFRANGAGTIVITTLAGGMRTCNFLAGETRAIAATKIWTSSTATGVEALI